MGRTTKSIKKDSQKLEARLAARSIGNGSEFLVNELEEDIDKLSKKWRKC